MNAKPTHKTEFKLGITMAGAVTAGAYSAGCLYYLLRNLEIWNQEKLKNNCKSIPQHKVTIEVLGGASAGSMVTAIAALTFGLKKDIKDIQDLDESDIQFDAWVNLLDNEIENGTLMALLRGNEKGSENAEKFSLFNSDFLDQLRDKIIKKIIDSERREWPVYISENLQILFTLTSLNGVPVGVSFSKDKPQSPESPVHYMKLHQVISHHKREPSGKDTNPFIKLPRIKEIEKAPNPKETKVQQTSQAELEMREFVDYALASGAFPIGFPPVDLNLPGVLLRHHLRKYFFRDFDTKLVLGKVAEASKFNFTAIDGGTLNNEPFVEVKNILNDIIRALADTKEKSSKNELLSSRIRDNFSEEQQQITSVKNLLSTIEVEEKKKDVQVYDAIMMIDPFPNFTDIDIDNTNSNTPTEIVSNIIGALRGQAMVKNPERILDFINGERFGMIFPSRRVQGERVNKDPHLATSSVGAFGGFLSKDFRRHDFILGMKNCQSFIRRYFGINETAKHKYHCFEDWFKSDERYQRFAYKDNDQIVRFPIIPDMALEHRKNKPNDQIRFDQTGIDLMDFPKIKPNNVTKYAKPLRRRLFYLGKKWLLSPSKPKRTNNENIESFVKPLETAKWIRKALIVLLLFTILGYLYWLLPTASFWLMLILTILFVVLALYILFRNAISSLFASLLRQLSERNQLDT